ncbi:MAG TPA: hypothetical protein GX522_03175 [Firmicutes bacterium]|nr:hypothetical protein [Bacillota bacterium]
MAICLLCKKETNNELILDKISICLDCERKILQSDPRTDEYFDLLEEVRPLAKIILDSIEG